MGPIMQERTTSTTLKRVSSKEKIRIKNAENTGPVPSSKKSNKSKKTGGQVKNGLPGAGQEKDTAPPAHRGTQSRGGRAKSVTTRNTCKGLSLQEEGPGKPLVHKQSTTRRKEEKDKRETMHKPASPCYSDRDLSRGAAMPPGKSRPALSLPLSPVAGVHPARTPPPFPAAAGALQRLCHPQEEDDSASDLSESERLPVLPSPCTPCTPCTPPHFDLRAEVINTIDFPPDFPGPGPGGGGAGDDGGGGDKPGYSYPDFLPPPFSSWSLRQLAVFLHTEGRGAPRPKPVGPLEKYLERLLQLEWLQVQTVQAESSRAVAAGNRARQPGFPHPSPRPHTAPPTRLNSPKGVRQGQQRAFPFVPGGNNPPSPAAAQPHPPHQQQTPARPPACPHCHMRHPVCNGSCSAYAYQRHCRLSPLLENKARPGAPAAKRSESEGRASAGEAHTAVSPSPGKSHARHMQAAGNARKPPPEPRASASGRGRGLKGSGVRAPGCEADGKREPGGGGRGAGCSERRALPGCKREACTSRRADRDWQAPEAGAQVSKSAMKGATKEPPLPSKVVSKQNGKAKNSHFVAK